MKALIFLLMSTAVLAAQDQPPPPAPEPPKLNGPRHPWQDEYWDDQVFRDGPFPFSKWKIDRQRWLKNSRAQSTTCYRLPGGRVACSQQQQTNPVERGSGAR
jgi:hypothetical protein